MKNLETMTAAEIASAISRHQEWAAMWKARGVDSMARLELAAAEDCRKVLSQRGPKPIALDWDAALAAFVRGE